MEISSTSDTFITSDSFICVNLQVELKEMPPPFFGLKYIFGFDLLTRIPTASNSLSKRVR